MKLADIKMAVQNAALSEFKRSFYNLASVVTMDDVSLQFDKLMKEVYADDED